MIGEGVDRAVGQPVGDAVARPKFTGLGDVGVGRHPGVRVRVCFRSGSCANFLGVGGVGRHSFSERLSNVARFAIVVAVPVGGVDCARSGAQKLPKPNDGGRFGRRSVGPGLYA